MSITYMTVTFLHTFCLQVLLLVCQTKLRKRNCIIMSDESQLISKNLLKMVAQNVLLVDCIYNLHLWNFTKVSDGKNFLTPNFFVLFFYQGFLSWTLATHKTAGKVRGPSFIPLYHFHQLTDIQTFICNFASEMTITYFQSQRLCLPDCYPMRFTTLSNYYLIDWCNVDFCLFACWFDFRFCYSYFFVSLHWENITSSNLYLC